MKKITANVLLILSLVLCSCESWIDVKPSDRLSDKVLFSSREGFLKALNGIYVEMAGRSLYGENLSAGAIDVMGQYYNCSSSSHRFYYHSRYTYTNNVVKTTFDDVWQKAYALINNCNILIEKCGDGNPLLGDTYFGIVKGEALALRAMLHLDLFRIFGPIYSDQTHTVLCMPYMTAADQQVQPLLSADEITGLIVADLEEALDLLKDVDPILTEGVLNSADPAGTNDMRFRQYRLNYYAVKTLLMRAHLCRDDKPEALRIAREIIAEAQTPGSEVFPAVTSADATNATAPDRMFSTEVIFALYKSNRINIFDELFTHTLSSTSLLTFAGTYSTGRVNELYDDKNDYRYKAWATYSANGGAPVLYTAKFADITGTGAAVARSRYMVPLMRISEVYLTAAECTDDLAEGIGYLNRVRAGRFCSDLHPANIGALRSMAATEFKKEVQGEGQLFFYYKRQAMQSIPNGAQATGNMTMDLPNYVVPLPDSETSQRFDQ